MDYFMVFMQHKKIYLTSAQTELKQDNGCCVKFWLMIPNKSRAKYQRFAEYLPCSFNKSDCRLQTSPAC